MTNPLIVAVGGFASNTGKTTLVCELLRALPGWEAIKLTRGHYRSCGKDPHACCVSHLLGAAPVLHTGRAATDVPGKDTGRFWAAGASNVHWLIATDKQVAAGIQAALARVRAPGVVIEGNSFWPHVAIDFGLMVAPAVGGPIKPTARRVLAQCAALYVSDLSAAPAATTTTAAARTQFAAWRTTPAAAAVPADVPVYTHADLPALLARVCALQRAPVAV